MAGEPKTVTVPWVAGAPERGDHLVMVTAYDFPQGRTADTAGVDIILVGDSLAMVVLGHPDTLSVTMDEMIHHTRAVRRGVSSNVCSGVGTSSRVRVRVCSAWSVWGRKR